jgi:hypothetical protein
MGRSITPPKAFALLFWELRCFFNALYDDGYADWKALTIIGCCEAALLLTLVFSMSVALGHRFLPKSKAEIYAGAFGVASLLHGMNYFSLKYKDRWKRFEREFQSYSLLGRVVSAAMTFLVVSGAATGIFWSATVARHLPR